MTIFLSDSAGAGPIPPFAVYHCGPASAIYMPGCAGRKKPAPARCSAGAGKPLDARRLLILGDRGLLALTIRLPGGGGAAVQRLLLRRLVDGLAAAAVDTDRARLGRLGLGQGQVQ